MTYSITVYGLVQGVGFRPYVKRLADSMSLSGTVCNIGGLVSIQLSCDNNTLEAFLKRLYLSLPDGAMIERTRIKELEERAFSGFRIVGAEEDAGAEITGGLARIPADIATCKACERELFDKGNRRYKHPFISCAVCGPRYSIIEGLPYDRENTVMEAFGLCKKCRKEYNSADDRRCYAQTVACRECGPELFFNGQRLSGEKAVEACADAVRRGRVVAIKDIGGYHFACDALNNGAVEELRRIKLREAKPFAVMFESVGQLRRYANVSAMEEELLISPARPIVLLEGAGAGLAPSVCAGLPTVGAMLPCNPVQLMLMRLCGPLVMTSGNISGEPIITEDRAMAGLASENGMDVLSHNRRIVVSLDDSVARVISGRVQLLRRGRGYVPEPLDLPGLTESERGADIIAVGGDLKAAFAVAGGGRVIMSQHFGDMENNSVREKYFENLKHMEKLYSFKPGKIICDLHPMYFSSSEAKRYAGEAGLPVVEIQHHLAHIMSVAAEHGIYGDFTGIAMDGTGFGTDGAVWGGEVFEVRGSQALRKFRLQYVTVAGGDGAARDAELLLKSYRHHAGLPDGSGEQKIISRAIENNINTVKTSSMGRLFDAVSAMLGICGYNRFEGECAMRLEAAAASTSEIFPLELELEKGEFMVDRLLRAVAAAMDSGADPKSIARGFHLAVVNALVKAAKLCGNRRVLISGGVFMNRLITEELVRAGAQNGLEIFMNEKVPPNDGGLALGQIAAEMRGEKISG